MFHHHETWSEPMRRTLLAAAAAVVMGGIVTGAALSQAQPAPPAAAQADGAPRPWMQMRHGAGRDRLFSQRDFALIYRQPDRQLGAADVQKIAEAFLLWNGNHSWKVTDVAATADGPIGFSFSTPEGSVIAKFTMDPHSGKITRAG
jgi:hypothetical protein